MKIGRDEGAEVLIGGERHEFEGELAGGYYFEPTVLKGHNEMRVFQEEIFGPVLAVTTFKDEAEALAIANDTMYGLGAGVWTRDGARAFRMGRAIKAGRVWTNCYHHVPGARGVRRLQGLRRRAREPPHDARPLLADQVPAGQLRPEPDGVLLGRWPRDGHRSGARGDRVASAPRTGRSSFFQSGGCCDGSSPICLRRRRAARRRPRPAPRRDRRRAVLHRRRAVRALGPPRTSWSTWAPGAAGGFSLGLADGHFVALDSSCGVSVQPRPTAAGGPHSD